MDWLMICGDWLRRPAFKGAEPVDKGIWLSLLIWCYEDRNGGKIRSCRDWTDRVWLSMVGVIPKELERQSPELWRWDGNDLIVAGYDEDLIDCEPIGMRKDEQPW